MVRGGIKVQIICLLLMYSQPSDRELQVEIGSTGCAGITSGVESSIYKQPLGQIVKFWDDGLPV